MPIKICPQCQAKTGCRRLVCECGYIFIKKEPKEPKEPKVAKTTKESPRAFPDVEPGKWIWDRPKGMPPIYPPDPLPEGQLSTSVVKEHIRYEGLGFSIYSFIKPERIADKHLRDLWTQAREAMREIVGYLDSLDTSV